MTVISMIIIRGKEKKARKRRKRRSIFDLIDHISRTCVDLIDLLHKRRRQTFHFNQFIHRMQEIFVMAKANLVDFCFFLSAVFLKGV
jgi:hypothetical protein